MKAVLNETKRILAVLLSVAMIFAYVPNNVVAYADDDVSGNNTEETAVEDAQGSQTEQAAEQGVRESEEVVDEREDYYADTNLISAGEKNHLHFVTLAGDETSAVENSGKAATDGTKSLKGDKNGISSVNTLKTDWGGYRAIDSDYGISGYVVADYGYTLPGSSDLEITVTGNYHDTELGKDVEIEKNTDYVIGEPTDELKYLDEDGEYEWSYAIPVTIKGSKANSTFLKKYSEYGPVGGDKTKYLSLWVQGTALLNEVPFEVTVDGVMLVSGYNAETDDDNTIPFDITDSVKPAYLGNYDVNVAIVDSNGAEKVKFVQNKVGNTDSGTEGKGDSMNGAYDDCAFYLNTTGGDIYFSKYGIKQAYNNFRDNDYAWMVEFTKKQDYVEDYTIVADSVTYAKIRQGTTATSGYEVKTTADKAKTDCVDDDELFYVEPVQGSERTIQKVEYFIEGMSDKKAAFVLAAVETPGTSNPQNMGWFVKGTNGVYSKTTDTSVQSGTTYYEVTDSPSGSVVSGIYCIPFADVHASKKETNKGNVTLFVTTNETVAYTVPSTGGKSNVKIEDTISSSDVVTIDGAVTNPVKVKAETNKKYSFTVTPKEGFDIDSVNAAMISTPTGKNASPIELTDNNFGMYTIANVTGKVEITVRVKESHKTVGVQLNGAAAGYTVKEKNSGTQIPYGTTAPVAEMNQPFDFVVTPNTGVSITKVEYTMGEDIIEFTKLNPVTTKIDGSRVYNIPAVKGGITLKVTTGTSVDVKKVENKDAVLTYNGNVIDDEESIAADVTEDLSFSVAGKNGAEVKGVYYATAGTPITKDNYKTDATELKSTSGVYTIGNSSLTGNLNIYIVTEKAAAASTYKAEVGSALDGKNSIDTLTLRAGGVAMDASSVNPATRVYDELTAVFKNPNGTVITGAYTFKTGIAETSKSALVKIAQDPTSNVGKIQTTNKTGTDTITVELKDDSTAWPATTVYAKEIALTTTALSTMFDKVELSSVVTEGGTLPGLTKDSKTIRAKDKDGYIDDEITYSLYGYTTKNGTSVKSEDPIPDTAIGINKEITSVVWKGEPPVADTVKPADKAYVLTPSTAGEKATIADALEPNSVDVTATLYFADGSELTTAPETLTITDPVFGYVAIPTVTTAGASVYNGHSLEIETVGSIKTSDIAWSVYKVMNKTAYDDIADSTYGLAYGAATLEKKAVDGYLAKGALEPATNVQYGKSTLDPANGIVSVTDGASSRVTAVKKGVTGLYLKATVEGMPVASSPIGVSVVNNITTHEVKFDAQASTYNQNNTSDTDYTYVQPYSSFDEGGTIADKYKYPTFKDDAAIKSLGTVSEIVDNPKATVKHSLGFALTDVKEGTSIPLPGEEAFVTGSISPKVELYGWVAHDVSSGNDAFFTIGDSVEIFEDTVIEPLWAYKFANEQPNPEDPDSPIVRPGVKVYRYDGGAVSTISNSDAITVAKSTTEKQISIPFAVGYYPINTTLGPDVDGSPQYAKDETITTEGLELKSSVGNSGLVASQLQKGIIQTKNGTMLPATGEALTVEFTDGSGQNAAVYKALGSTEGYQIGVSALTAKSTATTTSYTIEFAEANVELEAGQTETYTATIKKEGVPVTNWNNAFVSAKVSVAKADETTLKPEDVVLTSEGKVSITGLSARSTPVTVTVTATDANGYQGVGTFKATVKASSVDIIPVVEWTDGSFTYTEEQGSDKLYLRANVENKVTWKAKKNGALIDTTSAFDFLDTTDLEELEKNGEIYYDPASIPVGDHADYMTVKPKSFGVGEITVNYNESTGKEYTKVIPVVTYQAVTIVAPTTALKNIYSVYKNGTALTADKNVVEKIVYQKGKANYTFDSKPYTAAWIADTATTYDHYQWNNATNVTSSPSVDLTQLTEANKVLDLEEKITLSAAEWETTSVGYHKLGAAFGSKKVTLSNLPDTITLSDETLSVKNTTNGTDVAVIKMGVTPYDSANIVSVTGSDYGMYLLGVGDRGQTSTATLDREYPYVAWDPTEPTTINDSLSDSDVEPLISTATENKKHIGSKISGKARTDTFTVAKVNDPEMSKRFVGESKITVLANGGEYKVVTLYINGEFDTGRKNSDDEEIYQYMKNGKILQDGIETVQGQKHYYKDGARVNNGIFTEGGKLMLINGGAQVTTPGRTTFDGKNYYVGSDGYLITNQKFKGLVTSGIGKDNDKTYSADENGILAQTVLVKNADGTANYYDNNCQMAVAPSTANEYANVADTIYYVNAEGNVAISGIFKVDGKDRLFTEEGRIVTYADTVAAGTPGKYKVDGIGYLIAEDNTAKRDDILYNPVVTLSTFPTKWYKSSGVSPVVTYTGSVTSANTGTMIPISGNAVVTHVPATISGNETEIVFTATVDLSEYFADKEGKTKAEGVSQSATYRFANGGDEGISDVYYDTKVTWVDKFPAKWDKSGALPTVTYKISYKAASNPSKNEVTAPIKATVTRVDKDVSGNKVMLTATTDLSGYFIDKEGKKPAQNEKLEQTYTFKKNSPSGNAAGETGDDGKTESEPEESNIASYKSYNLFYTGQEIEVPGLSAALGDNKSLGTKADQYYKVGETPDTVVVSVTEVKKIKKAANASNSLISFTGSNGEVFAYQLPVYYQKPTLKLTKTSASIRPKTDGDTTVTTTVTQKKSTKLFEPLDITKQKEGKDYWKAGKGTAPKVALGEEDGELAITANAKGSGKIHIELENWAEGIDLSYSVKEVKKDTLTASAKTVYMNTNAESGDDQEVKIFLNGEEFSGKDAGITLKDWPKNWSSANVEVDGINEDKTVEGSTITFKYKGAPVKGNYSFKFVSKDNKAVTVKLSVSNKTLDKALSLSVKTKADIVTGQKMVVVPTLKYVGGPVEDVTLEGTDADKFELDNWNAATNQIIIVPTKEPTTYNTKTKYNLTVNVEAGGITCPIVLKNFKVSATKPSIKMAAVTMKVDGTGEAYTNLVATYKQGGKTFSIEPTSVTVTSAPAGATVTYEEGQFHIEKPTATGKVKVAITFADGKAQNKSFSIKKAK